jgi:hypothetical protein
VRVQAAYIILSFCLRLVIVTVCTCMQASNHYFSLFVSHHVLDEDAHDIDGADLDPGSVHRDVLPV